MSEQARTTPSPVATQERVREAAVTLFAARGFHGTGIRDLASAAGVSSATLYHYMGTKEDLLVAVMEQALDLLAGEAAAALAACPPDPASRLAALVEVHVRAHALRRRETRVVDDEVRCLTGAARAAVIARRDAYQALWRAVLDDGIAAGTMTAASPATTTRALLELCSGIARWYDPAGPEPLEALVRQYRELVLAAVSAPPPRP